MKIKRFEDIKAWQKGRELTKQVYTWTGTGKFGRDFGLIDQIQRASVSIMANISEGFDSKTQNEFVNFLTYSRRSASEVQSHLYVALDQAYISQQEFEGSYELANLTKNLIGGFINYLYTNKS